MGREVHGRKGRWLSLSVISHHEVPHDLRRRGVKADNVEHSGVVGVSQSEAVRGHCHYDQPSWDASGLAVLMERLRWGDLSCPGLAVGVDHEDVGLDIVLTCPEHRLRAVGPSEGQPLALIHNLVQ